MMFNKGLTAVLQVITVGITATVVHAETSVTCEPLGEADSIDISADAATTSDCGTYLDEAGENASFCQWRFEYRSDAAREAFSSSETALDGCFKKTIVSDSDVNHPDSYDQVFYATETQVISLSLKDKAGRDATYLFLRIETAP